MHANSDIYAAKSVRTKGLFGAFLALAFAFAVLFLAVPSPVLQDAQAAESDAAAALSSVSISDCKISFRDREYTGSRLIAKGSITYNGTTLEKDVDYTLSNYEDNILPGTAHVTVKGIGSYHGSVTASFEIVRSKDNYLALPGTWVKTSKGYRYKYTHNGKYAADRWLEDLDTHKLYRMSESGYAMTGLHYIDGNYYLFSSSTGYAKKGWQTYNNKKYHFASDYTATIGWYKSSGKLYRFSSKASMWRSALITVSGKKYYATKYGYMASGRIKVKGHRYVFDSSTHAAKTGLFTYKSHTYYASSSGILQTGWKTVNGGTYYFTSTGAAAEKCVKKRSDGTYWYMDSTGKHNRDAGVSSVLAYAKKLVNAKTPYLAGGDLKKGNGGTDCSGLVYYCFKHIGIKLSRITTSQQYDGKIVAKDKASIAMKKAKKGDIILTGYKSTSSTKTGHVVIYAGKNSSGDYMAYDEAGVYNNGKLVGARYSKLYRMGVSSSSIICIRRILS